MHVKVKDRLPAVFVRVDHNAVTGIGESFITGDRSSGMQEVPERFLMFRLRLVERVYMIFWDYQDVGWRLRVQVVEGEADIVLVHLCGRDLTRNYLAKDTVIRTHFLRKQLNHSPNRK
jgi:hypothetical protein